MIAALALCAALNARIAADEAQLLSLYARQDALAARGDLAGMRANGAAIDALTYRLTVEDTAAIRAGACPPPDHPNAPAGVPPAARNDHPKRGKRITR